MFRKPLRRRLAAFIAVRLVFTGVEITTAEAGPVTFDHDAGAVVLHYSEVLGELAEDGGPSLTIYGDGVVAVHYPVSMRRAGSYRGRLSPQELEALVSRLDAYGVLVFEAVEVQAERTAALRRRAAIARATGSPTLLVAADPSMMTIRLTANGRRHTATWRDLRGDANRYPRIVALQGLRAAQRELTAIMERPGLVRVD